MSTYLWRKIKRRKRTTHLNGKIDRKKDDRSNQFRGRRRRRQLKNLLRRQKKNLICSLLQPQTRFFHHRHMKKMVSYGTYHLPVLSFSRNNKKALALPPFFGKQDCLHQINCSITISRHYHVSQSSSLLADEEVAAVSSSSSSLCGGGAGMALEMEDCCPLPAAAAPLIPLRLKLSLGGGEERKGPQTHGRTQIGIRA